jgi:arginyl-tRNA synthetase
MNIFNYFQDIINLELDVLKQAGDLPAGVDFSRVSVEPPRDRAHGDLATNAAMVLAKSAAMKPRDIADLLAPRLKARAEVAGVDIAGPGFVNLRLTEAFWHARIPEILGAGAEYGRSNVGAGERVNVEYVSANPTGPLHVGHGRGTVFGDALASLLEFAGFSVAREYYINDAGAQIDMLARSVHLRYREALGEDVGEIPEGLYPGDYLKPVGKALADAKGDAWLDVPEDDWLPEVRRFSIDAMMALIREDLASLGVEQEVFTSERALVKAGKVDAALAALEAKGLLYTGTLAPPKGKEPEDWEPREQLLFRSTEFGDDVDRPLKKSDGSWTYFASDIAYHFDKFERGFHTMIDVWGADHGGHVKRMKAALNALTGGAGRLDVKLCQMVKLSEGGRPVRMSKRAGTFVTLRDVVDAVGRDVVRFIMLTRKNDAPLDFDLVKVTEQSKDNPVFYVQYAHARICSVRRMAATEMPDLDLSPAALGVAEVERLTDGAEIALIRQLAEWPRIVESAALAHEPHRIAFYLYDLASAFHLLWTRGKEDPALRFVRPDDAAATRARFALIEGVALVIAGGLRIFGVEPVEEMRG